MAFRPQPSLRRKAASATRQISSSLRSRRRKSLRRSFGNAPARCITTTAKRETYAGACWGGSAVRVERRSRRKTRQKHCSRRVAPVSAPPGTEAPPCCNFFGSTRALSGIAISEIAMNRFGALDFSQFYESDVTVAALYRPGQTAARAVRSGLSAQFAAGTDSMDVQTSGLAQETDGCGPDADRHLVDAFRLL